MTKDKTITREKIVQHLKEKVGFSLSICEEIVEEALSEIVRLARRDGKIMLQNFGIWKVHHKKTRPGFNMRLKKHVEIEPRVVFRFLASRPFKEKINK